MGSCKYADTMVRSKIVYIFSLGTKTIVDIHCVVKQVNADETNAQEF